MEFLGDCDECVMELCAMLGWDDELKQLVASAGSGVSIPIPCPLPDCSINTSCVSTKTTPSDAVSRSVEDTGGSVSSSDDDRELISAVDNLSTADK